MEDGFIKYFVPENVKKEILLNRGYWMRSHCFRTFAEKFATSFPECQFLSLGSGLDTLPFNLLKKFPEADFHYFETDLKPVTKQKIGVIEGQASFLSFMKGSCEGFKVNLSKDSISSKKYSLFPSNLNEVEEFMELLELNGVDFSKPTLVISECVLVYLDEGVVQKLLERFSKKFLNLVWADYEMFNKNDGFGKVMVKNFQDMGIPLSSIDDFENLEQIQENFSKNGFLCKINSMNKIYWELISKEEIERISALEWIDEFEEFNLMCSHYFISLAFKGPLKALEDISFELLK